MMRRAPASCSGLLILVGLATRRFGLDLKEIMDEAGICRAQAYNQIKALERLGVTIERRKEAVRGGWRICYRLAGIRGLRFDIRRQA